MSPASASPVPAAARCSSPTTSPAPSPSPISPDSASIAENLVNNAGGPSTLTKAGLGTLILNGTSANTYSGGTTVSAGTLVSSQGTNFALLGTGTVSSRPSATLKLDKHQHPGRHHRRQRHHRLRHRQHHACGTPHSTITGDLSGFTGTLNIGSTGAGKISVTPSVALPSGASVNDHQRSHILLHHQNLHQQLHRRRHRQLRKPRRVPARQRLPDFRQHPLTGRHHLRQQHRQHDFHHQRHHQRRRLRPRRPPATGGGTIVLSGLNDYTGKTIIAGQTIFSVSTLNNSGNAGNLGNNSTIDFGATTTGGTLVYTGTGETTDRVINLAGTTGGATITQSGTNLLKITGGVTAPGTTAEDNRKTLTLNGASAGTGELSGSIADSTIGTAGQLATSITKSGSGTWTLSGTNNSFTGGVTIADGNLVITNSKALGVGPKTVTINAGTNKMLHLDNQGGADITLAGGDNALNFTTSGINGVIRNVAGNNTIAGAITMSTGNGNTRIISDGGNLLLSGGISANTSTPSLDLSGTSTGEFSGALAAANAPAITKTGSGTWTLSGTNLSTGKHHGRSRHLGHHRVRRRPRRRQRRHPETRLFGGRQQTGRWTALIFGGGTLELAGGTHPEIVAPPLSPQARSAPSPEVAGPPPCNSTTSPRIQAHSISPPTASPPPTTGTSTASCHGHVSVPTGEPTPPDTDDGPIVAYAGGLANVTRLGGVIPDGVANNVSIINGGSSGNVTLAAAPTTIGSLLMDASAGPALIASRRHQQCILHRRRTRRHDLANRHLRCPHHRHRRGRRHPHHRQHRQLHRRHPHLAQ